MTKEWMFWLVGSLIGARLAWGVLKGDWKAVGFYFLLGFLFGLIAVPMDD